jgi:ABC-type transporter Mla subunit MlaD
MRVVRDAVTGQIAEDAVIYGTLEGPATVRSGVTVVLYGATAGPVFVERTARLQIYGANAGQIVNRGLVVVQGVDVGEITDVEEGRTQLEPRIRASTAE